MIVLHAAPEPAPSWPASTPTEESARARFGSKRALSEAYSKAALQCGKAKIYPSIKGSAFVNAEAELVLDPQDPFCMGIRA